MEIEADLEAIWLRLVILARRLEHFFLLWQNAVMDGTVLNAAQRLQQQLEKLDPSKHRDSLVWAHGFLTSLIERLELRMPDLVSSQTRLQSLRANLDELLQRNADLGDASHDSLERLMDDIDPGEAPVPAKRKPSPKGRSGGAAAQPPESELPM